MRTMILILPFLIALPGLVMAEAPPVKRSAATQERRSSAPLTAEEFLDQPISPAASEKGSSAAGPEKSNVVDDLTEQLFGRDTADSIKNNPNQQACRKSKTEMEKYENCWLQFIRDIYRQHPYDLVELLVTKLRLAEKKRITGKISKEEADVLRAEAHVQFEGEIARRTSLAQQEERGRDDQELQKRILDRDIRRSERDLRLRESEYQQERLRRERDDQEREQERFDRALRDMNRQTQTDCSTDKIMGSIHCTTR